MCLLGGEHRCYESSGLAPEPWEDFVEELTQSLVPNDKQGCTWTRVARLAEQTMPRVPISESSVSPELEVLLSVAMGSRVIVKNSPGK